MTSAPSTSPLWTWAHAEQYWSLGYTPFPIQFRQRAEHTDKVPLVEGWTDPTEEWIAQVWSRPHAHIGLGLRGALVGLDADTPGDAAAIAEALPGHPSQRTPYRDGLHLVGRVPATMLVKNGTKRTLRLPNGTACKVDIRAEGGFLAWYGLPPVDPPPFPLWLASQLDKAKRSDDLPRTAAMAQERLREACAALAKAQRGTGNDTICRWAYAIGRDVGAGLLELVPTREALWRAAPYQWDSQDKHAETLDRSLSDGAQNPSRRVPGDAALHVVNGKVKADAASLQAVLATLDCVAWDAWHGCLCLAHDAPWGDKTGAWGDAVEANASAWIAREYELNYPSGAIHEHAQAVALGRTHTNRLVEWLTGLAWDGVERLDNFVDMHFTAVEGERAVFRKWCIAAVARAMLPGCKVDSMLILNGPQGIGKSAFLKALAPWDSLYSDSPLRLDDPRDLPVRLAPVWLYELAELASINRREHSDVRALLSSACDDSVPKYARNVLSRPRHTVFCGTSNPDSRLTVDPGGMRRFWVLDVGERIQRVSEHAREQAWAEAVARWRMGEPHWFEGEAEAKVGAFAVAYAADDNTWMSRVAEYCAGRSEVSMCDVLSDGLRIPLSAHSRRDQMKARECLLELGYAQIKRGGTRVYVLGEK